MSFILEREIPPLCEDVTGAIRVGNSRVLLETVIRAFQDGASPESIVHRYSTLSLSDVDRTIGYYFRHQDAVETYLNQREWLAKDAQQRLSRHDIAQKADIPSASICVHLRSKTT
jgi:uncharacterized protein (DUF433 family)